MGIYISGVKGLPEQVQENKNKIKEVEEQIEGIDFEAVRQLQGQVAENTQDINNLEASIGVQNQAINGLKDRADALESKTQLMSYNDDLSKTDFRNSIEVADDVITRGLHVSGDGTIANANGSGLHFQEGPNDDTLTIANKDGAVSHYLQLHADGTLTLDDQPVGATALYEHNVRITRAASTARWEINIKLITTFAEAFANATAFNNWFLENYASGVRVMATGKYAEQVSGNYSYGTIINIQNSNNTINADVLQVDFTNSIVNLGTKTTSMTSSQVTLYDNVRQIA